MLVALVIEGFAEVERLLPSAELDFHGPAGAVDGGELAHVGLCFVQVGEREVLAVAEESFRAVDFTAIPCFFTALRSPCWTSMMNSLPVDFSCSAVAL